MKFVSSSKGLAMHTVLLLFLRMEKLHYVENKVCFARVVAVYVEVFATRTASAAKYICPAEYGTVLRKK